MIFRSKCRHKWVEVARKSVPGVIEQQGDYQSGPGLRNPHEQFILYGFTTIELRCEECGEPTTRMLVGTITHQEVDR